MRWDWRRGVLYLSTMGMEGCWLYAVIALLNTRVSGGHPSVIGILALFPIAVIINMLLRRLKIPGAGILAISWMAWVVALLLMVKVQLFSILSISDSQWFLAVPLSIVRVIYFFRPERLIILSTAAIWWLSWRLASRTRDFTTVVGDFQFGLAILVMVLFIASQIKVTSVNSVALVLAFFFFALLGIAVAHAMEGTSWLSGLYRNHWSGLLVVSICLVLVLGLIISSLVTPGLLQSLWTAIKFVLGAVWAVIITAVTFFASLFPSPESGTLPPTPGLPTTPPTEEFDIWTMPGWLLSGLRFGWSVVVLGLILFALWRVSSDVFRWLSQRLVGRSGAEYEPMRGAFKLDVVNFLKSILFRLFRLKLPFRKAKEVGILSELTPVRQLYRDLLSWAAAGGLPRRVSQTPFEYNYALAGLLPGAREDFDLVTRQYARARYGAWLPTQSEMDELSQAWHRVKQNSMKRATAGVAKVRR
jgi:hypothetical protein